MSLLWERTACFNYSVLWTLGGRTWRDAMHDWKNKLVNHSVSWCSLLDIKVRERSAMWKALLFLSSQLFESFECWFLYFFFQRMHTENFLAGIHAMYCLEAFQADRNFSQNAWFLIINVTLTGVEMVEEVTLVRTAYSLSRRSCQCGLPGFIIPYNNVYPWNKISLRF